jgi:putative flippase GtrA
MTKIKQLFCKYRELIVYTIFGAMTAAVNLVAFYLLEAVFGNGKSSYLLNNVWAWLAAVIFAYVTNKLFVFESRSWAAKVVSKELVEFFGARIFSFVVEEAGLWLSIDLLGWGEVNYQLFGYTVTGGSIAKLVLTAIVIILNYFFSKFIIFKKEKPQQ